MANILLVEDEPDTLDVLARLVQKGGHHPVTARNGWEALLALDANSIDLVVLDLMMPGMDGGTFLRILRNDRRRKDLPVILVTAVTGGELLTRSLELGVDRCFHKASYSAADLVRAIDERLDQRQRERQHPPGGWQANPGGGARAGPRPWHN